MSASSSPVPGGNRKNLIFALLIAFAFVFALPFIVHDADDTGNEDTVLAAAPVNPTPSTTWDFTSATANGGGTYGGGSWSWVQSTRVLTLNGLTYSTSADTALLLPANSTIMLNGTSSITGGNVAGTAYGIQSMGPLIITSNSTGSLNVKAGDSKISNGISAGQITITGSARVTATGGTVTNGSLRTSSCGIYASENITIGGDAIVTATGGTVNGGPDQRTNGIWSNLNDLIVKENAKVTATGGAGTDDTSSCGIFISRNITIDGDAVVTATGGAAGKGCGIGTGDLYEITMDGNATLTAAGGAGLYSYGISSVLNIIEQSKCTVTASGNSGAISNEYIVQNAHMYYVNNSTSPPSTGPVAGNSVTTVITTSDKYAKILPDTIRPTVVSVTPAGTGEATEGYLIVTFSKSIATGGTVDFDPPVTLSGASVDPYMMIFKWPYSDLEYNTKYDVHISGFKDWAGNEVVAYDWSFTTEAAVGEALTGTATIDNTSPKIGDTLNGSLVDGNNAGTLTYQWKAGGGYAGTGDTYTVTVDDLGKIITLEITSDNKTGTVVSSPTSAVSKKPAPPAPPIATLSGKTYDSVTLQSVQGYEYSNGGTNWTTENVFTNLYPGTEYTFYQRIEGTADTLPSDASPGLEVTTDAVPYGISLSPPGDKEFEAETGYGAITPYTVTVNNIGTNPTGPLDISLYGDVCFALSGSSVGSIAVSGSDSFTVVPNSGLTAGTYSATIIISGDNGIYRAFDVSFKVTEAVPSTNVTFAAAQTGGASGTADSTGIVITFSQAVTGLTESDITIANGTGAVTKGALSGSGKTYTVALASVTAEGSVTVSVANFGTFSVTTGTVNVSVYKDAGTPPSGGDDDGGGMNIILIAVVAVVAVAVIGAAAFFLLRKKP